MQIPLYKVNMPDNISQVLDPVLRSGFITEGPQAKAFEEAFQKYIGNPNTALVNSGTSALTLALKLAGVGPGTETISSPMTCLATNAPVMTLGADIVWCDVDPSTGNIDADKIEALITPKTKAILFVDWAGTPAELDKINAIAAKHGIKTIEDAAHAIGSTYKNRMTGTSCDYTCFIGSTKILTKSGYKRIDEIAVGDEVFGEEGTYNKVVDTMRRDYVGEWVNIKVGQRKISMTADHPIKIHRSGQDSWLEAKEVREEDYAYVVTKKCEQCKERLIPFYNKRCITCIKPGKIDKYDQLDPKHSYDDVVWITRPALSRKKRYQYEIVGNFARVKVSSVKRFFVNKNRKVYNLSVERSPTYCAKGILVHNCFSFQAIKHLTTIDGGALACRMKEDYDKAILLRWFGLKRGHNGSPVCWEGDVPEAGFKMHMNDVNATIGLEQLKYIDGTVQAHRSNGNFLMEALKDVTNVETCAVPSYVESSFWFFTIRLENPEHRAAVNKGLTEHGIGSNISHTRNDTYSVFDAYRTTLPGLDDFGDRMLNVPCGWWVDEQGLEHIVKTLKKVS